MEIMSINESISMNYYLSGYIKERKSRGMGGTKETSLFDRFDLTNEWSITRRIIIVSS